MSGSLRNKGETMEKTEIRPVAQDKALAVLTEFLRCPLYDGSEVLQRFRALPNAQYFEGTAPMERYVYIPGARKDRVLLLAHADTVWDENYLHTRSKTIPIFDENRIKGSNAEVGLGADDRAGCALLWLLKDSGHSLLIFDGEEHGHLGAKLLRKTNKHLLREFNRHRYMISLDLQGKDCCHYHGILNSRAFCKYIEEQFSPKVLSFKGGTDVSYVARGACGVNLSIGYHKQHSAAEYMSIPVWYESYVRLCNVLSHKQPRFRTQRLKRMKNKLSALPRRAYRKLKRVLHIR